MPPCSEKSGKWEAMVRMQILVGIDDTDNIEFGATGQVARKLSKHIEKKGWGRSFALTRHQLLIHADIPYTSHNSSMCFGADIDESYLDDLIRHAADFMVKEMADGSDPGLCIAVTEHLSQPELLVEFGFKAKKIVLTKQDAYDLAEQSGVHLSEHGGTGQGVIGALAGVGLRLGGNDGRTQGQLHIISDNDIISVGALLAQGQSDLVKTLDGAVLGDDELIELREFLKNVLLDGKFVLLVCPADENAKDGIRWQSCSKTQLVDF
jgi:hypothetical protein